MQTTAQSLPKKLIPGLIFGFVVIVGLALLGDLREVSQSLLAFEWQYFLAAICLTLVNYLLRFFKWHQYLKWIGAGSIRWPKSMRMFVSGFPLAVTPGKVGEALKAVWLKGASGLPIGRGVSVVLAERISDGLAVLMLSTLGVVTYPQYWPAFVIILGLLLLIVAISQVRPLALFLLDLAEKIPLARRFAHGLREFYEGSFALFRPGALVLAVALGTFSWLFEGLGFYCILLGLGLQPSWELVASAVFVLSFSTVIGAASALPGGLGAAEISIAGLLTLILGDVPAVVASATLLIRLATLWFGVALGLLAWVFSTDLLGLKSEPEQAAGAIESAEIS